MPNHYTNTTTTSAGNTSRARPPSDSNQMVVNGQTLGAGSDAALIQMSLAEQGLKVSTSISINDAALMVLTTMRRLWIMKI